MPTRYRERERELFARWKKERPDVAPRFVVDGAVDGDALDAAPERVLFLLKDPYDDTATSDAGVDWSLLDLVQRPTKIQRDRTWSNICRWTVGLQRWREDVPEEELFDVSPERRVAVSRSIVVMNLKKQAARQYRSSPAELTRSAREHRPYLREQLALYRPTITVCCATAWWLVHCLLEPEELDAWQPTPGGRRWFSSPLLGIVVDQVHPAARRGWRALYQPLIATVRAARHGTAEP
jgi:hypothetical protein